MVARSAPALLLALLLSSPAATVSKGAWDPSDGPGLATGPPVDCEGAWSEYGACSASGERMRRYQVKTWFLNGGTPCPASFTEFQPCTYPGPQRLAVGGGSFATRGCASPTLECANPKLLAAVGDTVTFDQGPVVRLASMTHFRLCLFNDSVPLSSEAGPYEFEVTDELKTRALYFASTDYDECVQGKKVRVHVEGFQRATLEEVLELLDARVYETEEGAELFQERIWCFSEHCPDTAMSYYQREGDAQQRCLADAYALLGLLERKRPGPRTDLSGMYYAMALREYPEHCEARAYLGALRLQLGETARAEADYSALDALSLSPEAPYGCRNALEDLLGDWCADGRTPPGAACSGAGALRSRGASAVMVVGAALVAGLVVMVL